MSYRSPGTEALYINVCVMCDQFLNIKNVELINFKFSFKIK